MMGEALYLLFIIFSTFAFIAFLLSILFNTSTTLSRIDYFIRKVIKRYKFVDTTFLKVNRHAHTLHHIEMRKVYIKLDYESKYHPIFYFSNGVYAQNNRLFSSSGETLDYIKEVLGVSGNDILLTTKKGVMYVHVNKQTTTNKPVTLNTLHGARR